jgi:hypothetical protein
MDHPEDKAKFAIALAKFRHRESASSSEQTSPSQADLFA